MINDMPWPTMGHRGLKRWWSQKSFNSQFSTRTSCLQYLRFIFTVGTQKLGMIHSSHNDLGWFNPGNGKSLLILHYHTLLVNREWEVFLNVHWGNRSWCSPNHLFISFLPIKHVTCSNCSSHAYLAAMVSGRILRTRSWAPWALGTDDVKTESLLMLEKGLG
jgi:hypothetical protein